mgnify:FL=1
MNLNGKNIIVTGGAGFGVAGGVCKALTGMGAQLIIFEKSKEKIDAISAIYPGAITVAGDVSVQADAAALFELLEKKVGVVHGLVNNAGIGLSKPFYEAGEQEFDNLYAVDVKGVWLMSKFFTNQLLKNHSTGNIVNISSVHALATMLRYAIYASAKAAVEGFTRGMAVELGKYEIRVNAVAPGYVHAEQNYDLIKTWTDDPEQWVRNYIEKEQVIPQEIHPVDCGHTVAFLLSDLSRSITGQVIYVDNGSTIKLLSS